MAGLSQMYPGVRMGTPLTDRWRSFLDHMRATGVVIDPTQSGGYNPRNIAGTNTPSLHATDRAYDINWQANPEGSMVPQSTPLPYDMYGEAARRPTTQIHPDIARDAARRYGMRWGGDFRGRSPDPMHFEVASDVPMASRAFVGGSRPPSAPFGGTLPGVLQAPPAPAGMMGAGLASLIPSQPETPMPSMDEFMALTRQPPAAPPVSSSGPPPNQLTVPTLGQEAGSGRLPTAAEMLSQFRPLPPAPTPPPFGAPEVTPEPNLGAFGSPFGASEAQQPGADITAGINQTVPPGPDADAIMQGATAAAAARPPTPQGPGFPQILHNLANNPLFMAGLSILGTAPGGNWGPAGAQAAMAATRAGREQSEYERLQGRRSVMDRVWAEAFPNGQPNAQHPLLQSMPPEMASTIFAMGPEEGLALAQRWQMFRGQQAEQLRTLQARADIAEGRAPAQPGVPAAQPPGAGLMGATGLLPTGSQLEGLAAAQPSMAATAPPAAPGGAQPAASEPTVSFAGETMTLGQAQARARRLDALGMRSELLERTIADAISSQRLPDSVRTQSARVDQAYRSLLPALDSYARLVEQTGATVLPGQEADSVKQARTNILLQLKELYNLGVLNGPDLTLMEQMLPDPSVGIGLTGPYGIPNIGPGSAAARVAAGVNRLKEILRTVRNSQPGLPPAGGAQAPAGGRAANDPLGIR